MIPSNERAALSVYRTQLSGRPALTPEVERDLARLMRILQRNEELRREANGGPVRGLDGPQAHGPVGLARRPGGDLDAPQAPLGAAAE